MNEEISKNWQWWWSRKYVYISNAEKDYAVCVMADALKLLRYLETANIFFFCSIFQSFLVNVKE